LAKEMFPLIYQPFVCIGFLAWRQLEEFREIRIHVVPRLSARCVNIRLGPIPARVVQAPYHDIDDTGPCGRLAKQPAPQVEQKPRCTMLPLSPVTS